MSQKIIKYLQDNKDKYSKKVLIVELKKIGYKETDINNAVSLVYATKTSFWDFKSQKIYTNKTEKTKDFFFGLVSFILINIASFLISLIIFLEIINVASFFFIIFLIIYLFNKRRFIAYGLMFGFILPILFFIILMPIFMGLYM